MFHTHIIIHLWILSNNKYSYFNNNVLFVLTRWLSEIYRRRKLHKSLSNWTGFPGWRLFYEYPTGTNFQPNGREIYNILEEKGDEKFNEDVYIYVIRGHQEQHLKYLFKNYCK